MINETTPPLRTALFVLLLIAFGLLAGLGGYYAGGRSDAIDDALPLARLADRLKAHGQGGDGLGERRVAMLLAVADPRSTPQARTDLDATGPGLTKLTRSLARRIAFDRFEPGVARIRLAGYASGLETQLSKRRILSLWLETVEMGQGPKGGMRGFYVASRDIYHRPPKRLSDDEFLHLVAVATAPSRFRLDGPDPALEARVARLRTLIERHCGPLDGDAIPLHDCGRS